jgi:uncharacterized protein YPO0396
MSDTPRTDILLVVHDLDPKPDTIINHSRQLERELNAENNRIKRLEDRIHRASNAFFADASDKYASVQMLQILEEERRQKP